MSYKHNSHGSHSFFKETLFAQIILVLIFLSAIWFFRWSIGREEEGSYSGNNNTSLATVIINLDNAKRMFEGEVPTGMTVLDALSASANAGQIFLDYQLLESGDVLVNHIDGHSSDGWEFVISVNDQSIPSQDLNRRAVNPGDIVEIEFQSL